MQLSEQHRQYWRRTLLVTTFLLLVWFAATFVGSFFARELNQFTFLGFPLGFYLGAQGALFIYLLIIGFYAYYMNSLDEKYGAYEEDEE